MKAFSMFGAVVLAAMAVACGESYDEASSKQTGTMTVHGTVSSRLGVDNARAVAIGTDGRTFWAYLDRDREFTLQLPVGQSYRVIVANQRSGGGQQTVGHLVLSGADGRTEWLGANSAMEVNLGTLRIAESSGTKIACADKCGGSDDDYEDEKSADHDDDYPCKSGDKSGSGDKGTTDKGAGDKGDGDDYGDKEAKDAEKDHDDCDVCTDKASDKELEPSKKPGSSCADKDKEKHADKDDPKKYGDKKSCPKSGGSDKGGDTSDKGTTDKTGDAKSGDTGSKDAPAPSKDGSDTKSSGDAGEKSEGSKCNASTECKSTCSCVASTCAVKK